MPATVMDQNRLAPVEDFRPGQGWADPGEAQARARWCCEQLEDDRLLFFETLPFELPETDRAFLVSQRLGDSRFHKNISYRPKEDALRGFAPPDGATLERMHDVMRRYSAQAMQFLSRILAPYASAWSLDYASFRPEAEEHRKLPLLKRNDLLHVDAFPSRPTRGGRILRCFTNINPTEPRVWQTTDPFPALARQFAREAGLDGFAARNGSVPLWATLARAAGIKVKHPSAYDRFMLRFHDFLKENSRFQGECAKIKLSFPPGSTWIGFTDSFPHAVLTGQCAVEQTLIIPVGALLAPGKSPLRVLEGLAGRPLA